MVSGRFVSPGPDDMSPEQLAIYRLFTTGRRAAPSSSFSLVSESGRLQGPPAAWVLAPPLGRALEQLGSAVRFELTLPPRASEMAILMVAHHHRSPFELHAHTRAARAQGWSEADLAALAAGRPPEFPADAERVVYGVARQVLDTGTLDEDTYSAAVSALTAAGLFELVTLIGYYTMLALQLSVFDLRPPDE